MPSEMREMRCAVCGSGDYEVRYEARLPDAGCLDFAARRPGRHYHPRIVECRACGQVYSNPYFSNDLITNLYHRANYISEPQLANMTRDYVREFERALGTRPREDVRVLEIGCADGFFLKALKQAGYRLLQGVEPGEKAVAAAPPDIRPHILNDFFHTNNFPAGSFDAVCCFQIMDHLPDPAGFVRSVYNVLAPGGIFLAINHDIRAPLTRLLGERSPMYDIEHVFLFDRSTMKILVEKAGLTSVACEALFNSYTLDYAIKMFPLPEVLKRWVGTALATLRLSSISLRIPGGNMVTVARRG